MKSILILSLTLLISCGGRESGSSSTGSQGSLQELQDDQLINAQEVQLIELVNSHRFEKGLAELKFHKMTILESQNHTTYMAQEINRLTHNGFSDRVDRIRDEEEGFISRSGENIAYNSTLEKAHNALLNSYGHRKNIEGDYTHIGVGVETNSQGRLFVTQIFIKIK